MTAMVLNTEGMLPRDTGVPPVRVDVRLRRIVNRGLLRLRHGRDARVTWSVLRLCICSALLVPGCTAASEHPKLSDQDKQLFWRPESSQQAVSHPGSVVLAQGTAPLVYQVQQPGDMTVKDLTSGRELARTAVRPGTIVWIDQRQGVNAGENNLLPGPLPGGHSYGISIATDPADSFQSGAGRVTPRQQPSPRQESQ